MEPVIADLRAVRVAAANGPLSYIPPPVGEFAQPWRIHQDMLSPRRTIDQFAFTIFGSILEQYGEQHQEMLNTAAQPNRKTSDN